MTNSLVTTIGSKLTFAYRPSNSHIRLPVVSSFVYYISVSIELSIYPMHLLCRNCCFFNCCIILKVLFQKSYVNLLWINVSSYNVHSC